jgi:4-amino-4-deoxy-L-arabinose transferase-like glycosyltransferase
MSERRLLFTLLAAALAIYVGGLGTVELTDVDESRSGTIVRDMAEGGHWLLPRTPDGYLSEKPPAYYGLCALLGFAFGVSEWTLRIVSVLMAVGTLGLVWTLARLYGSPRAAAVAVVALLSNILFMTWARMAYVDMTFTFFCTAGLTAYFAAREGRLGAWPAALLAGAAFGLAVLSKGPLGAALPVAVLCGDVGVRTRGRFWQAAVPWGPLAAGLGLSVLVALAYYLPALLRGGPEFLETSILSENVYMPLGKARGIGVTHYRPIHYYPLSMIVAFLPVLPLLPEVIRWSCRRDSGPGRAPLATWFAFGFLLFMAASNKRRYYLLPLQPAVAVMMGLSVERWLEETAAPALLRWGTTIAGAVVILAGIAGGALVLHPAWLPRAASDAAGPLLQSMSVPLLVLSALVVGAGAGLLVGARRSPRTLLVAIAAFAFLVTASRTWIYGRAQASFNHTRPFVQEMLAKVPPGVAPRLVPPVRGYALDFYWPAPLVRDEKAAETAPLFFIASPRYVPSPALEVLGTWRNSDDRDDDVLLVRRRQAADR